MRETERFKRFVLCTCQCHVKKVSFWIADDLDGRAASGWCDIADERSGDKEDVGRPQEHEGLPPDGNDLSNDSSQAARCDFARGRVKSNRERRGFEGVWWRGFGDDEIFGVGQADVRSGKLTSSDDGLFVCPGQFDFGIDDRAELGEVLRVNGDWQDCVAFFNKQKMSDCIDIIREDIDDCARNTYTVKIVQALVEFA